MQNKRHRGVRLLELAGGRWVGRHKDAVSGRIVQTDLLPLGLTNENLRTRWAIAKSKSLAVLRAQVDASGAGSIPMPIEKAHADYLDTLGNQFTRRARTPPLRSLVEALSKRGVKNVQDITGPDLVAWAGTVHKPSHGYMPATRNLYMRVATTWLRWCRVSGWLPRVDVETIANSLPKVKLLRDAIDLLQPPDIRKLLAAAERQDADVGDRYPHVGPLVLLLLLTGLRWGEGAELLWHEVDLAEKCIRLPAARTKTATGRTVTLSECPTLLELLAAMRLRAGKQARVFPWASRDKCGTLRRRLTRDYGAPAGWSFHQLRRTCGSLLVNGAVLGGATTFLTAKRLGHSLVLAEKAYLGALRGVVSGATTIEAAGGFEAEARAIVARVAGVQAQAVAQ